MSEIVAPRKSPGNPVSREGWAGGLALRPDVLAVSLVLHFLGLALPLALLQIYDRILPAQAYGTAVFLVTGVGIAIVLEAVLRYGRQAMFANIGARYEAQATMQALDRLQLADITEIERRGGAVVADALRAVAQVRDFWSGQAGAALYELPFVLVYIVVIGYVGGWLAIIPLVLLLAAVGVARQQNPSIAAGAEALERAERQRHDFTWTSFAALNYLKAIGAEGAVSALWRRINSRYLAQSADLETRMGWLRENAAAFGQLSTVLIVAFGAGSVVAGELTTGALAACTMLAGRSIGPAMASLGYWSQLARIGVAQARVDDLLALPDNSALGGSKATATAVVSRGEIRIEAAELFPAAVTIPAGEVVHLDTANTPLASRLLTAISGMSHDPGIRVTVDGRELVEYSRDSYRDSVMLVSRHLALVPGSILNNLTLYNPRYNADVQALCEALGLQTHLDKLRQGVLTEVGPATAESLDEGITQRIAIIRALLRKPRILLLDHAASGIDLDGVKRLAEMLKSMQGHTTVLIATYKEPLIAACNRSLTLDAQGGRV